MYHDSVLQIYHGDTARNKQVDNLLAREGICRDKNLDYTCGIFDEEGRLLATGSSFGNTLRCFAVSKEQQGEGLINRITSHLINMQFQRGNAHLFLYTKNETAKFFADLGFYKIVELPNQLVFMENRKNGFSSYLARLERHKKEANQVAAIVMNANPFSLGHLYLIEKAAAQNDIVHLFIVSEDASLVPFEVRKKLVLEGTAHLKNICYHESGSYMISNATFPSYFLKDDEQVVYGHALLDIEIFKEIANALGVHCRYIGEEPNSQVTSIYNEVMKEKLPTYGISCVEILRKTHESVAISASNVRRAIKENNMEQLAYLVPETTLRYFLSSEAIPVIARIQKADTVIHH